LHYATFARADRQVCTTTGGEEVIMKINCWEFMKCGREPGGNKVHELGVCPAAANSNYDGLNSGHNGGRICWAVSGTFCNGVVQGTFAEKRMSCLSCDFFAKVREEEPPTKFVLEIPPTIKAVKS